VETIQKAGEAKGTTTFEEYAEREASAYMFDNDLLEQSFKFWESDKEKHDRIKAIWIDLKRKNALGGLDARSPYTQDKMTRQIISAIRDLRFKMD
jgi:hypothetical protein